ncbi:MAG: hypothetical protein EPO43_08030 [Rugosibacter sp.]|nr:MAG: hypothetical protein EPO43_08030 [Rugosibacter sp.]
MMTSKPKNQSKEDYKPVQAVPILTGTSNDVTAHNCAELATAPELAAMRVIRSAERKTGIDDIIDVPALMDELRWQGEAAHKGDLSKAEAMLMNQATALQSLFARLTERAMGNEHIAPFEANMRMALRAQSQCRATLETLAAIKNPPVIYAKQANVTTGPQQINNGTATPSQARQIESEQSQLSGGTHELLPDTRTSQAESRVNPALETLGEINRAEVPRG